MKVITFTNRGKRELNQDFVLIQNINSDTKLFLVVDGMGGYEDGEIASKLVTESIFTFLSTVKKIDNAVIQKAVNKANLAIKQFKEKSLKKMGATVGGILLRTNEAICFWVGDVKIFHFENNCFVKESTSHTLTNEITKNGSINNIDQINKYKHVVTRSIQGDIVHSQIEAFRVENLCEKDMFIICSDGVHDIYDGLQIQQILNTSEKVEEAFLIIENRLEKEAKDNFSLISIIPSE